MELDCKSVLNLASGSPIPVLFCRGSHFDVGFQIGSEFKDMIQDLLNNWSFFKDVILHAGQTTQGKYLYEQSLSLCRQRYPKYVDEIRGMAKGAEIEFEKLFMLNIDSILETLAEKDCIEVIKNGGSGCTTIMCNKDEIILGHTEDAMTEIKDHVYIISAEIIGSDDDDDDDTGKENILEKFTTLCYAGTLMGYTMGYNSHGMIYSVNTAFPSVCTTGTPRSFIARALLGSRDLPNLINTLKDKGNGISDGFSLNVYFYPQGKSDDKGKLYNIEVAPPQTESLESVVDVMEVETGSSYVHCNRFLRIKAHEWKEDAIVCSNKRMSTICQRNKCPSCELDVKELLSDQTDYHYPIYNNGRGDDSQYEMSFIRTVAVGIFNVHQKTWSVYTSPPTTGNPVHAFYVG